MKVPDLLTFLEVCCIIFYRCADLKKSQSGSPSEAAKLVRRLSFFVLQDAFAAFVLISDSCTLTPSFLFDRIIAIASNILLASGVFMRFPPCICFPRMDSLLFLRISPLLPLSFHLLCRNLQHCCCCASVWYRIPASVLAVITCLCRSAHAFSSYIPAPLNITTIEGNGAACLLFPNFKRPFTNLISDRC